jgi:hypothetical protein
MVIAHLVLHPLEPVDENCTLHVHVLLIACRLESYLRVDARLTEKCSKLTRWHQRVHQLLRLLLTNTTIHLKWSARMNAGLSPKGQIHKGRILITY